MKTKLATIEITTCIFCPHNKHGANQWYNYCELSGVDLRNTPKKNILYDDNIPRFCPLPNKE